jgi:H+/gluconate symporter-like permease
MTAYSSGGEYFLMLLSNKQALILTIIIIIGIFIFQLQIYLRKLSDITDIYILSILQVLLFTAAIYLFFKIRREKKENKIS